jgi:V-type H+-transporting ATPase 16kDa proteolipid subunit
MTVEPAFLTGLGAALSIFLASLGSAIASAEAGIYALRSKSGMIAFVPIIIAGVLAIYGIIISVLLAGKLHGAEGDDGVIAITTAQGYRYLCAGLSVGLACAASGLGMANFIKQSNAGGHQTPSSSVAPSETVPLLGNSAAAAFSVPPCDHRYMMVMVFLEAIALYGLIVALFLLGK